MNVMATKRSFFLTHNLTCGATISMSRAVFTSFFPHLSLILYQILTRMSSFFLYFPSFLEFFYIIDRSFSVFFYCTFYVRNCAKRIFWKYPPQVWSESNLVHLLYSWLNLFSVFGYLIQCLIFFKFFLVAGARVELATSGLWAPTSYRTVPARVNIIF